MQILDNVFNKHNINIMLDIETTGKTPGCRVLSIGLAYFTRNGVERTRYILPALDYQVGFDDPLTLRWWSTQTHAAKSVFADNFSEGTSVKEAAEQMVKFIGACVDDHRSRHPGLDSFRVCLWGNGSSFDNAILARMFRDNGVDDIPWNTFGDRCYRTVLNVLTSRENRHAASVPCDAGIQHHAIDDACRQARALISALEHASK